MAEKIYAVPESKLTQMADTIRLKRDIATPMDFDEMILQTSLIDGGGGLQMELIGEETIYLPETSETLDETELNIDIVNSNYAWFIFTISCDGICEANDNWGGYTLGVFGRHPSNRGLMAVQSIFYRGGGNNINEVKQYSTANSISTYGVGLKNNVTETILYRKTNNTMKKAMAGNYTIKIYGFIPN